MYLINTFNKFIETEKKASVSGQNITKKRQKMEGK